MWPVKQMHVSTLNVENKTSIKTEISLDLNAIFADLCEKDAKLAYGMNRFCHPLHLEKWNLKIHREIFTEDLWPPFKS